MNRNKYYENEIVTLQNSINNLKTDNEEFQKNIDDNFLNETMKEAILLNNSTIKEFENQVDFYKSQIRRRIWK